MTPASIKIPKKGQANTVAVKPVRDAAASLSECAGNVRSGASMRKIKDKAWEEAVCEKNRKGLRLRK